MLFKIHPCIFEDPLISSLCQTYNNYINKCMDCGVRSTSEVLGKSKQSAYFNVVFHCKIIFIQCWTFRVYTDILNFVTSLYKDFLALYILCHTYPDSNSYCTDLSSSVDRRTKHSVYVC